MIKVTQRATSYNRAYLAPCLQHSAQIPLQGTSDTPGTLYDIPPAVKEKLKKKW